MVSSRLAWDTRDPVLKTKSYFPFVKNLNSSELILGSEVHPRANHLIFMIQLGTGCAISAASSQEENTGDLSEQNVCWPNDFKETSQAESPQDFGEIISHDISVLGQSDSPNNQAGTQVQSKGHHHETSPYRYVSCVAITFGLS